MGNFHYKTIIKRIEENVYQESSLTNLFNILLDLDTDTITHYQNEFEFMKSIEELIEDEPFTFTEIMTEINQYKQDYITKLALLFNCVQDSDLLDTLQQCIHLNAENNLNETFDCYSLLYSFLNALNDNKEEDEELIFVIELDDLVQFNEYIENKQINLSYSDYYHNSLLHYAAGLNSTKLIDHLIEHGLSINQQNDFKRTPLLTALYSRSQEATKLLFELGSDLIITDEDGNTAIHLICQNNELQLLDQILASGYPLNIKNKDGQTPLDCAIMNDQVECVTKLLNLKPEVLGINQPLFYTAIKYHSVNIFHLLIKSGYDIQIKDQEKAGLLHYAAACGCIEIAAFLLNNNFDINALSKDHFTPLLYAIMYQHHEMVQFLIEHHAVVNSKKTKESPLYYAIHHENLEIVKLLVAAGADLNSRHKTRNTLLAKAVYTGNSEILTYLLQSGADVNKTNRFKTSTLYIAVNENNSELVKILIQNGADVNYKRFFTPLYSAIKLKNQEIMDLLIQAGANVNQKVFGSTYLHKAVENNDEALVIQLLEAGAYINIKDYLGLTVLDHVKADKNETMRNLLISRGKKFTHFIDEIEQIHLNSVEMNESKIEEKKKEATKTHKNLRNTSIGVILFSCLLLLLIGFSYYHKLNLYYNGITTTGIVTEKQVKDGRYRIRYQFEIDHTTYKTSDFTGRSTIWSYISEEDYKELEVNSPITIKYLKANPSNNEPLPPHFNEVEDLNEDLKNTTIVLVLAILLMGIGIYGLSQLKKITHFIQKQA